MIAAANQNEPLDALVWRILGAGTAVVQQVMALNPNLAGQLLLPEGTLVTLPDYQDQAKSQIKLTQLWD
ncbi:MAG: hypothetical protein FD163_2560 [Hyphomonadaceae bacterium]|nr:MAG: hypothetical protein FD128_2029 [Hyphomonadaceae bacterium]KAF0182583.1 MAG: hypothetical protein FD163_2560 [Hyphomonadaceae bacterium]